MAATIPVAASASGRRVVVTGMGVVSPLGRNVYETWSAVLQMKSGVTSLKEALLHQHQPDTSKQLLERELSAADQLPCQVAAAIPRHFLDETYQDSRAARCVQMSRQAAAEAVRQAGLWDDGNDKHDSIGCSRGEYDDDNDCWQLRAGVSLGCCMPSVGDLSDSSLKLYGDSGYRKLSPHTLVKILSNSPASRLSMDFGLLGPCTAPASACAASAHAIGEASNYIRTGIADIMLAGGTEASIDTLSLGLFSRMRALSTSFNQTPEKASRPFDIHRDGFVMGEGAAVLVLEEWHHAVQRQQPILAELTGYGISADSHHATAPHPDGNGAARAMRMALRQSQASSATAAQSSGGTMYVNAHATSTPKGDEIEYNVIQRVLTGHQHASVSAGAADDANHNIPPDDFGPREVFVSSTKGATGHLLGAAGALEAVLTVQALRHSVLPPTLNLNQVGLDDDPVRAGAEPCSLQHVRQAPLQVSNLDTVVSNSFGFGGTNASLVFRKIL